MNKTNLKPPTGGKKVVNGWGDPSSGNVGAESAPQILKELAIQSGWRRKSDGVQFGVARYRCLTIWRVTGDHSSNFHTFSPLNCFFRSFICSFHEKEHNGDDDGACRLRHNAARVIKQFNRPAIFIVSPLCP